MTAGELLAAADRFPFRSLRSNIALISTIRIRPKTCWSLGLGRPRVCGAPFSCPVRPLTRAEEWRAWSAIV